METIVPLSPYLISQYILPHFQIQALLLVIFKSHHQTRTTSAEGKGGEEVVDMSSLLGKLANP